MQAPGYPFKKSLIIPNISNIIFSFRLRFHCFENIYAIQMLDLFRFLSTQIVKTKIYAVVGGTEDQSESNTVMYPYGIID